MDPLDRSFARLQEVVAEQHDAHDLLHELTSAQPGTDVYDEIRACHDDETDPDAETRAEIARLVTFECLFASTRCLDASPCYGAGEGLECQIERTRRRVCYIVR